MTSKHVYYAWAVTFNGKPEWDIRLAFSPEECWSLALRKFNAKSKQSLKKRGIGIVRVLVTVRPL
jgi:hypothetical protein